MIYQQRWVVVLLLVILLASCSEAEEEQLKTQVAQAGETVVAEAGKLAATQAAQLKETTVPQLATQAAGGFATLVADQERDALLAHARTWIDAQVSYDQGKTRDNYRTDCSGFVSYVWQLPPPGPDTTRFVSGGYAVEIPVGELQPGDALNNNRPGDYGHIVLFVSWLDAEHNRFEAYDMSYSAGASAREFTLELGDTGWTIKELDPYAQGPYYAQRLKNIP